MKGGISCPFRVRSGHLAIADWESALCQEQTSGRLQLTALAEHLQMSISADTGGDGTWPDPALDCEIAIMMLDLDVKADLILMHILDLSLGAFLIRFSAIADPHRRFILEEMRRSPCTVGEISEKLPISRPAVSQHMKILLDAGMVSVRSEGRKRIYILNQSAFLPINIWIDQFWAGDHKARMAATAREIR